ncbi:translocation/assembly module TamB domain-containing protein [Hephaestia mangrovi]|uniref:translocation/assembly module TamB domain-containing protein n=1 Tax=Hephaestia mangrovi TaxID=2873268 RepID=UPI001CA73735|nr:translocation/assembly module TamB domain-containing protein [Hephaestia mangrovi]MBY8827603.1 translocation/assembly module TamB domain-containing protein [Hephaestia mangrovi]
MVENPVPTPPEERDEEVTVVERRPPWQRILKWIGIAIVALIALVGLILLGLNTGPGRRFVANRIAGYTMASGLNISVGRIDGSIYGAMVLKDVRVRDTKGVFLMSPEIDVDWRPFKFINNHIDVRSATSRLIVMTRNPALKATPSQPNQPILPNIDIDVNRLAVDRLVLEPPVSGAKRVVRLNGAAHIADRRAQITANAAALSGAGVVGGDRLAFKLDAVPDDNKLDIDAQLRSPADGIVAGLSGVKKPITVSIGGTGDWKAWNGKAVATLGGQSLADLTLAARDGTFKVRGNAHPGLYMAGAVARLTAPRLDIALDTTLNQRQANSRLTLRSSALAVDASGLLDLGNSRFGNFQVDARLLTPGAVAPKMTAKDAAAHLTLDGAFATPSVGYVIRAASIGIDTIAVEGLYATGQAKVNANRILIPVNARAARVTGLNAAAGGLLDNVTINGDLAIDGSTILSDNLHLKSNKIDATAIIAANMATGRYTGALKGRVNDYRVDSIGVINVVTDANLVPGANGGWGIKGHVVARTSQIFNSGARSFLGGNATVSTDLAYDTNGVISFSNLRLNAPQFRVTSGSGRYDADGRLLVNADAFSTKYGPLTARVTGSATNPDVLLRAPRPGLGVGLANLEAHVRGANGAYAAIATGDTDYGPFSADVTLRPGKALTVDVDKLLFAGVDFHGRVQQTAAGPFAGDLAFAGSGLSGNVKLGAQDGVQRADIAAHGYNAKIPGQVDFTIGRALVNATVVMYPNAPAVTGDVQVADLHYGPTAIAKARAKIDYHGGKGTAQLVANGSNGVPFNISANGQLAPHAWLVALEGNAAGVNFRTANPARVVKAEGSYQLAPTRIEFDRGTLRVAGKYGDGLTVQARLDRLDLVIVNAFVSGLDIGGVATGSMDFSMPKGGGTPNAQALITINDFTRSSISTVSSPVDITLKGALQSNGADVRALVKRGDTAIGRLVATMQPLGGGESWTTRLANAPLNGGIRYNGPAAVLFSLSGLANQQLTGPIAVAADFSGQLNAPRVNGLIRADNLTYENETYGTRLTSMAVQGRFNNDRFELTSLSAKAGDGSLKAQGSVGLAAASGFPIDVTATFDNARLARGDSLAATTTGTLKIHHDKSGGQITGDLSIPEARYQIVRQGSADVPELDGIRRKGQPLESEQQKAEAAPIGLFRLNIRIHADNELFVSGMGLDSEWKADLRVRGTTAAPRVTGEADVVRGTYSFAGKRFDIDHGIVHFEGGALTDPTLDISASTSVNDIDAVINITGTAQKPQIEFTSTPALPQDEVLSRLLFGDSPENLSAIQAIQLAAALNSLRGSGGGLNPLGKLRSATGIDRLEILGADQATGRETAVSAGKYITNNIYVSIITDARGFTATQLEVSLTKALSALSEAGSFGGSSVSLRYKKNY